MKKVSLGPLEQEIAGLVWKNQKTSVRDVWETLLKDREIAYNTVQTVLTRLVDKGILKRKLNGKTHVYAPANKSEKLVQGFVQQIVKRFGGGYQEEALLAFVDGLDEISEETRNKLIKKLRANESKK